MMTAIMYYLVIVTKLSVMLVDIFHVVVEDSLLCPITPTTPLVISKEYEKKRKMCRHDITMKYMLVVNIYIVHKVSDKIL